MLNNAIKASKKDERKQRISVQFKTKTEIMNKEDRAKQIINIEAEIIQHKIKIETEIE